MEQSNRIISTRKNKKRSHAQFISSYENISPIIDCQQTSSNKRMKDPLSQQYCQSNIQCENPCYNYNNASYNIPQTNNQNQNNNMFFIPYDQNNQFNSCFQNLVNNNISSYSQNNHQQQIQQFGQVDNNYNNQSQFNNNNSYSENIQQQSNQSLQEENEEFFQEQQQRLLAKQQYLINIKQDMHFQGRDFRCGGKISAQIPQDKLEYLQRQKYQYFSQQNQHY